MTEPTTEIQLSKIILTFLLQCEEYKTTRVSKERGNEYRKYIEKDLCGLSNEVRISNRGFKRYPTTFIAFLGFDQTIKKGIYPVLLYSVNSKTLIISYGVSASNKPSVNWDFSKIGIETPSLLRNVDFIKGEKINAQEKYGNSYLYKFYNVSDFIKDYKDKEDPFFYSPDKIEEIMGKYNFNFGEDLIKIIYEYKTMFEGVGEGETLVTEPHKVPFIESKSISSKKSCSFKVNGIIEAIKSTNLIYSEDIIKRYVYSLLTKPFVILSGLSGSGKTQLALSFALTMVENQEKQICFVPVGADWTNREPLLGYPNALKPGEYIKPESGVLSILMEAQTNPHKPYFLILDEMNLSYVERYFADFLSAMESKGMKINLWDNAKEKESEKKDSIQVPSKITLPRNLFITGTNNVD